MKEKDDQLLHLRKLEEDEWPAEGDIVASATECTGLIPTPPLSAGEAESYAELYHIPQPENKVDHGLQHE